MLFEIVRVVEMRVEKVPLGHRADAAGVELRIGMRVDQAGKVCHGRHHARILEREEHLRHQRIVCAERLRGVLLLAKAGQEPHLVERGERREELLRRVLRQ